MKTAQLVKWLFGTRKQQSCKTCRFGNGGRYDLCWVGTYYAEQGKSRFCVEGELWEATETLTAGGMVSKATHTTCYET